MKRTELDSAQYWVRQHREWIERNGGNAAGYQIHYAGSQYSPADIQAIYEADVNTLRKSAERVAFLLTKQPRSKRKESA